MQVGKGSVYGTLLHHTTPSRSPHNALHSPSNWASVSEPHTSELNRDFSSNIIIIIIICRTSFRIFLTL